MITSIVILTKNQLEYTKQCLQSIRTYTSKGTYEIIIVDNASNDGTREWLKQQSDIKLILNDENKGFPKGCNQGIEIAIGDNILLLNNDVVVTFNWLDNLLTALYSSDDVGAVGPITNSGGYYSSIDTAYENIVEMQEFAQSHNISNPKMWKQRVKLIGFCMLIKKVVVDKVGYLEEMFSPGNYEDDDYSYRIQLEGYRLLICHDTFIHHYGNVSFKNNQNINYTKLVELNAKKFEYKWGFNSHYSSNIRFDILEHIDAKPDAEMNILEVGCATGATLLEIKNQYKNSNLFGIELNENSAAISQKFIDVRADNVEKKMSYSENFFDYIIFGDVLEHLYDPWSVLDNIRKYLKPDGHILISIPNVMHYSVVSELINGGWKYKKAGILDKTHVRFFTLKELVEMLTKAHYVNVNFYSKILTDYKSSHVVKLVEKLKDICGKDLEQQYNTYQYIIVANKMPDLHAEVFNEVEILVEKIELEIDRDTNINKLVDIFEKNKNLAAEILDIITKKCIDSVSVFQKVGIKSFENKRNSDITLFFLYTAYEFDKENADTIFNIAYVLFEYGEIDDALLFLAEIKNPDEEIIAFREHIEKLKI